MKAALSLAALSLVLATPTYALEQPRPGKEDSRIRYVNYNPNQVVEIWTAPGGLLVLEFGENELVPEGNVAINDASRIKAVPRGNFLYLKSSAKEHDTPCIIPEPLLVTTKLPNGGLRPYQFQIETRPTDCSQTPAVAALKAEQPKPGISLVGSANAAPKPPPHIANLEYVEENGLAAGADVMYKVVFKYPADEAAKRAAAEAAKRAAAEKAEAQLLLKQQVSWPYGNRFDGTWNYRYAAHGNLQVSSLEVRDNGYQTVFILPSMERDPALFRWNPGADHCNRQRDEHNESTVIPSVHRSGADGDTIIASGTAQGWCFRDGNTVMEIRNFAYNPTGATPATGTVSPYVRRTIRGDALDDSEAQQSAPAPPTSLQPLQQPRAEAQTPIAAPGAKSTADPVPAPSQQPPPLTVKTEGGQQNGR